MQGHPTARSTKGSQGRSCLEHKAEGKLLAEDRGLLKYQSCPDQVFSPAQLAYGPAVPLPLHQLLYVQTLSHIIPREHLPSEPSRTLPVECNRQEPDVTVRGCAAQDTVFSRACNSQREALSICGGPHATSRTSTAAQGLHGFPPAHNKC